MAGCLVHSSFSVSFVTCFCIVSSINASRRGERGKTKIKILKNKLCSTLALILPQAPAFAYSQEHNYLFTA